MKFLEQHERFYDLNRKILYVIENQYSESPIAYLISSNASWDLFEWWHKQNNKDFANSLVEDIYQSLCGKADNITNHNISLTELPTAIFHCNNITKLDFSNSSLSEVDAEIFTLSNLKELKLSNSKIAILPQLDNKTIKNTESNYLELLDLSYNPRLDIKSLASFIEKAQFKIGKIDITGKKLNDQEVNLLKIALQNYNLVTKHDLFINSNYDYLRDINDSLFKSYQLFDEYRLPAQNSFLPSYLNNKFNFINHYIKELDNEETYSKSNNSALIPYQKFLDEINYDAASLSHELIKIKQENIITNSNDKIINNLNNLLSYNQIGSNKNFNNFLLNALEGRHIYLSRAINHEITSSGDISSDKSPVKELALFLNRVNLHKFYGNLAETPLAGFNKRLLDPGLSQKIDAQSLLCQLIKEIYNEMRPQNFFIAKRAIENSALNIDNIIKKQQLPLQHSRFAIAYHNDVLGALNLYKPDFPTTSPNSATLTRCILGERRAELI